MMRETGKTFLSGCRYGYDSTHSEGRDEWQAASALDSRLLEQLESNADVKAARRDFMRGLASDIGRVRPKLVLVFSAQRPSAAEAVICPGARRKHKIVSAPDGKWILNHPKTRKASVSYTHLDVYKRQVRQIGRAHV